MEIIGIVIGGIIISILMYILLVCTVLDKINGNTKRTNEILSNSLERMFEHLNKIREYEVMILSEAKEIENYEGMVSLGIREIVNLGRSILVKVDEIHKVEMDTAKLIVSNSNEIEKEVKILDKTSDTSFIQEKKVPQIKSIAFYKAKIEEFMNEKRRTLDADTKICKRIGLSIKALHSHIGQYRQEKDSLSAQCKANSTAELKERFYKRTRIGKGKK